MRRTLILTAIIGLGALIAAAVSAQEPPPPGDPQGRMRKGPRMRAPNDDEFIRRHDKDGDGKLTLDELTARARRFLEEGDADGDGALDKDELRAAREKRRAQRPEGRRGPGGEGRPEGAPPRGRRPGGPGGRGEAGPEGRGGQGPRPSPEEVFERMDTDGDGVLSLEEFKAGHKPRRPRGGRGPRGDGPPGGGRPRDEGPPPDDG